MGHARMTAAWMMVRADLRRRWRAWVVLGILAGISVGLAGAAVAGSRRAGATLPRYVRVAQVPDAAVLANDPEYDEAKRAEVAALPEVERAIPFVVAFALSVTNPAGLDAPLLPIEPRTMTMMAGPLVAGRLPDPARADEIVVNEHMRDHARLPVGATLTLAQAGGNGVEAKPFEQQLRVVGISKDSSESDDSMPSPGFYDKYRDRLVGITNQFIDLRHGQDDFVRFQADVERVVGHPVNVASTQDIFGLRKLASVSNVEQGGLLLFALAVVLGAGVLVGQSLVRSVTAGAAELETWHAIGADRRVARRALVVPVCVSAVVGAACAIVVAAQRSSAPSPACWV
jgi:ABC-type lipoprotein release transport system permease subunit